MQNPDQPERLPSLSAQSGLDAIDVLWHRLRTPAQDRRPVPVPPPVRKPLPPRQNLGELRANSGADGFDYFWKHYRSGVPIPKETHPAPARQALPPRKSPAEFRAESGLDGFDLLWRRYRPAEGQSFKEFLSDSGVDGIDLYFQRRRGLPVPEERAPVKRALPPRQTLAQMRADSGFDGIDEFLEHLKPEAASNTPMPKGNMA